MKRVAFHTLGCKVNQYETEAMERLFEENDYKIVSEEELADVYVINTCTVTNLSDRKSRQFIRRVKKINEDAVVAVVGCYSQVSPDEVEEIEGVDVIIGTSDRNRIVELCEIAETEGKKINIVRDIKTYDNFENMGIDDIKSKTRAYIKVQDGCNQFCSYCIIPYARGPIRSRNIEDIIDEVMALSKSGFKELIITGIHVASYGKDLGDIDLGKLIQEISKVEGIERIRLSSVEPNLITHEFMDILTKTNKVCHHFHLSLQSGSNRILKKMNRKYTREEYMDKVRLIREYMPDAGITTDIIVGFPGETELDFRETMEFVKEIGFSRIHVFKYSPRKGTPAAKYDNQVHGKIKNKRSRELIALGEALTEEFNGRFIDRYMDILYEEEIEGFYEGYTSNYIRVKTSSKDDIIGNIVKTRILNRENGALHGEIRGWNNG